MIAEYERAQILERSRRGKRHRALQGVINVLSGAIRTAAGTSERANIRRPLTQLLRGLSIGAITRLLNEKGVPTRKGISRWERSTVWAMLRNPAYKGTACFNKTKSSKRQRITRPIRSRGGIASRDSASHERPRAEWIEIPVQIYAVLVHSPDRLSRKYAYQVLLMEEFARNNIETLFINAPQTATPEDHMGTLLRVPRQPRTASSQDHPPLHQPQS
jgi:DNA invertase Pin-like site-specific DNA recombinase